MTKPLLWAIFLGCSWTWVIGMFLPVLLVRDYGAWGWLVFAAPNVIGAAAMGWVLRDAAASERFVHKHQAACRAFSIITIAYHVFFALWMIERLSARGTGGWGLIAIGVFAAATLLMRGNTMRWIGAISVLLVSLSMWWMLHRQQSALAWPPIFPRGDEGALWKGACLFPVFVIGFGLCPYLDLTFHRARQNTTPAGGRFAFGLGFGIVFFSMIVFTLLYARWLRPAVDGQALSQLSTLFLTLHIICQGGFTVAAHVRELDRRSMLPLIAVIAVVAPIGWYASTPQEFRGRDLGEAVYWCLLGVYGIAFPGYLLVRGRHLGVLALCSLIAFPMYWAGFVEGRPLWLIPGVLIVLSSGLISRMIQRGPGRRSNGLRLGSRGTP